MRAIAVGVLSMMPLAAFAADVAPYQAKEIRPYAASEVKPVQAQAAQPLPTRQAPAKSQEDQKDQALVAQGHAFLKEKRFGDAIVAYTRVIEADPEFSVAWEGRGLAYAQSGQQEAARRDFDKAISLNPQNGHAFYNRAILNQHTGDQQAYAADLKMAAQLGHDKARGLLERMPQAAPSAHPPAAERSVSQRNVNQHSAGNCRLDETDKKAGPFSMSSKQDNAALFRSGCVPSEIVGVWYSQGTSRIDIKADGTYTSPNGGKGRVRANGPHIVFTGPLEGWNNGRGFWSQQSIQFYWRNPGGAISWFAFVPAKS